MRKALDTFTYRREIARAERQVLARKQTSTTQTQLLIGPRKGDRFRVQTPPKLRRVQRCNT